MSKVPNKAFKVEFSDDNHVDLSINNGSIVVEEGKDEWVQANKIGLIGQEGDWRFDPREGLPWVDNGSLPVGRKGIMGSRLDTEVIELYVMQQLNREPRNRLVKNVNTEWGDISARELYMEAEVKSIDGDLIEMEV